MISISSEKNARALIKAVANNSEEAWVVIEKESMKAFLIWQVPITGP